MSETPTLRERPDAVVSRSQGRRHQLVYVLAASHSGSTLLTMLLAAHPDVCTVGELKTTIFDSVEDYHCSCGELITRCGFWAEVGRRMEARGLPFDVTRAGTDIHRIRSVYVRRLLRPLHRGRLMESLRDAALSLSPTWRSQAPLVQRRNAALVDIVCSLTGGRILVDSSKVAVRLKYLLRNKDLDVKIIRLVRDGRAVALTYYRDEGRVPIEPAALEWKRSNEEAEALLAGVPRAQWTEVRYERLCAEPRKTMEGLFGFLGVDKAKATLDFRSTEQHIVGNHMRLEATTEIRLDDRWRTMLTAADLAAFDRVAGDLNRSYGYR